MAEAWFNHICGDFFNAESAGLEPGTLNPLVVEAMREVGIDISQKKTQAVFDVFKSGKLFAYAVTVCDATSAETCPIFAGVTKRVHWSFDDPSALTGTHEEKMAGVRRIRAKFGRRSKSGARKCALKASARRIKVKELATEFLGTFALLTRVGRAAGPGFPLQSSPLAREAWAPRRAGGRGAVLRKSARGFRCARDCRAR